MSLFFVFLLRSDQPYNNPSGMDRMTGDPRMAPMNRAGGMGDPTMGGAMAGGMATGMGPGGMGMQPGMQGGMAGGGMGGMAGGMGGPVGTGPMDHHRSASMPGSMGNMGPGGPAGPVGMGPGQASMMQQRSRSASRGMPGNRGPGYHSLDREAGYGDRDFMPIREPRERSLDRDFAYGGAAAGYAGRGGYGTGAYGARDRSLERGMLDPAEDGFYRDPMMGRGRAGMSPNPALLGGAMGPPPPHGGTRDNYIGELQSSNNELQRDLANLRKELELTNQKLGSSMHSIKTFWSPELKKERALRKEESAKYSLINDQLKLLNSENQVRSISLFSIQLCIRKPYISFQLQIKMSLS